MVEGGLVKALAGLLWVGVDLLERDVAQASVCPPLGVRAEAAAIATVGPVWRGGGRLGSARGARRFVAGVPRGTR